MEINTFNSTYRKRVAVIQTSVEQKIDSDNVNIGKIICVNANVNLDNIEMLNGEAYYNGVVTFDSLYTDEQGNLLVNQSTTDLNGKITDESINANMLPVYKAEIVNVTISNATSNGFRVNASVEITLDAFVDDSVSSYESTSETIKTKKETVNVFNLKTNGSSSFNINSDVELKSNDLNVLFKNASVCVKDVKSGTGYFTLEGDLNFDTCYEMGEEDNKTVKCFRECVPFKEEIEVQDLTKEDTTCVMTNLRPDDFNVTVTINQDGKAVMTVSAKVGVKYFVLSHSEREITVDAYSTTNNLNLISESFKYTKCIQSICENKTIDCDLTLQEEQKRISKILFVCGETVNVTNSYIQDDKLSVEGIISANIVYLSDDDNEEVCSAVIENPFKVEIVDDLCKTDNIFVKTCIKECNYHAKRGKEISLEFELTIKADIYDTEDGSYLKDVEIAEEYQKSQYSLQIFFAPTNSDAWEIGKQLHCDESEIEKQNPDLQFPLSKPEQIVYFIQK